MPSIADHKCLRLGGMFTQCAVAPRSAAAGPVRVQTAERESTSEREVGQHLGRGVREARHSELGQTTAPYVPTRLFLRGTNSYLTLPTQISLIPAGQARPFQQSVVRNPDFIYKQVHNPDVTNPDLADVRVTHLFVSP